MKKTYIKPSLLSHEFKTERWILQTSTIESPDRYDGAMNKDNEEEDPEDFAGGY